MAHIAIEKAGSGMSSRVSKLRERVLTIPEICTERARLMTESYKETEGQPNLLRRAKALQKILSGMTIRIDDDELIVGTVTSKIRGAPILPEIQWEWIIDEMETLSTRDQDRYAPLAKEEKTLLREILPYWKGKSLYDLWRSKVPESALRLDHKIQATGGYCENGHHPAHCCPNYERLLAKGLNGIKQEVDEELSKVDYTTVEGLSKYEFLKAVNITLDAVKGFAQRYSKLAGEMAAEERNSRRKAELERISEICAWVPANPPRSFYEALQSIWLVWISLMMEGFGAGMSFGRADQYLYPLYKKDISEGVLTEEEVRELITLLYIKMNGVVSVENQAWAQYGSGFPLMLGVTLGGVTKDGKDAVNELSYLFLDTDKYLGLTQEDLVIRVHHNNPDAWVVKACEVAKICRGKLKFISDETTIQGLLAEGKPIEYARDYVSTGCHACHIPGRSRDIGGVTFNIALMVELALNNGAMRLTGEQIGPKTGDPRKYKSYEEIWDAYKKQVETLVPVGRLYKNVELELQQQHTASPFQSALFDNCIHNGRDVTNGGTAPYAIHYTSWTGLPDVADSLAAIKKVVFDDKKITMAQLINALEKNFEGEDAILHLLSSAPKFGNDDDYVDSIMMAVSTHAAEVEGSQDSYLGFKNVTSAQGMTANIPLGQLMGASPDGRKAREPLTECISPHQGRNKSGPTATYRSVAKIDHAKMTHGSILNMRFNPDALKDHSKIVKFAAMMRTFFETGGDLVQFNIIDSATLKAAQKNPERYKDLIVRVATYSAYFVELFKESQDDIIARMEFEEV